MWSSLYRRDGGGQAVSFPFKSNLGKPFHVIKHSHVKSSRIKSEFSTRGNVRTENRKFYIMYKTVERFTV